MELNELCRLMPKVELHVHIEGSIRPETVLKLAKRNGVSLPAGDVDGLREWYRFRDFRHFVEVYLGVTKCIKTAEDLELIFCEFADGQKEQNILHTEATFSASTIEKFIGISWPDQHQAMLKGIAYANSIGVSLGFVLDIVRGSTMEMAMNVAEWATSSPGVLALGLAGEEHRGTAEYAPCFELAHKRGVPIVPHTGETQGPASIWETLEATQPLRIGHGVRCVEDPLLVKKLRELNIPLETCPGSNVALGVYPSLAEHSLPTLLDEGLYVTINSDDPPMFGTSLTEEFVRASETFDFDEDILWSLCLNAANAAILSPDAKRELIGKMREQFSALVEE